MLKKENKELAIKYDNAMNSVIDAREDAEKLRSKVDKAIEEINNCKVYGHTKTARLVSLPEVLGILKRNLKDIDFYVSGSPNIKLQKKKI